MASAGGVPLTDMAVSEGSRFCRGRVISYLKINDSNLKVNGSVVDADYYPALSVGRDFNGQSRSGSLMLSEPGLQDLIAVQSSMPGILYPPAGTSTLFTVFFGAQ